MDVTELLSKVDLVDYVSQYCDLEEKNGEYWGLSPLKEEKTPSFSIDGSRRRFYDFSSGTGGNVITFIQRHDNCSTREAFDKVRKFANITEDISYGRRLETVKIAKKYKPKQTLVKDLKQNELSSDIMDRYEYDIGRLAVWNDEGISFDAMNKFLVRYDSFSNRLVMPIRDYDGNIINVCGRTLDEDYKSKKLRKYTYFYNFNGSLNTLYGFYENKDSILERNEMIIFEGAKSVMMAYGWGIKNCTALLTSHLSAQQLIFLIKLGVRVVFAVDKDANVLDDKNIEKLKRYVDVEYICDKYNLLDEKMSPVDRGEEVFKSLYKKRIRLN